MFGRGDPLAARERVDLRCVEALSHLEIEGVEGLDLGKACFAEALADDGLVPGRQLGAEHLLQIVFVRPARVASLAREALEHARDARQLQGPGVGNNEVAGKDRRAHALEPPRPRALRARVRFRKSDARQGRPHCSSISQDRAHGRSADTPIREDIEKPSNCDDRTGFIGRAIPAIVVLTPAPIPLESELAAAPLRSHP